MSVRIVHSYSRYAPPSFASPAASGHLHIAATVAPPSRGPFVRRHGGREALVGELTALAAELERLSEVVRASVYRAVLIPPTGRELTRPARHDVVVLVESRWPHGLDELRARPEVQHILTAVEAAGDVHVMSARCARRLGTVDRSSHGLFLFNHFVAADPTVAVALWEHLAAWYIVETGLANSTLLAPIGPSDYVLVNHASWSTSLLRLAAAQFTNPTFRSFVQANLRANDVIAMPILYRLVWTSRLTQNRRIS